MRWAAYVARMGQITNAYKILVDETERNIQLGRLKSRWEDIIRKDLSEIEWKGVFRIHLAQDKH
jgi:hypothetical protein